MGCFTLNNGPLQHKVQNNLHILYRSSGLLYLTHFSFNCENFITQCFPFFLLPFHVCPINPGYVCICGYKKKTLDTGDETKMHLYKISLWFATSTGIYKNIFLWVWQLSWKRNLLLPLLHNPTVHRFSFISWIKGRKRIPFIKHQIKMKEEMWDFTLDHYFLKNV